MHNNIVINNQILPKNKALISIQERGFLFGDGIFETIPIHYGIMYNVSLYLDRLDNGLRSIKINFNLNNLKDLCLKLIRKNNVKDGILRIHISRGIGSEGYLPKGDINPLLIIETKDSYKISNSNIFLWLSKRTKISLNSLPVHYKLSQGVNSTLARMEAKENNCFDSILLNDRGEICETSSSNIFWAKNKTIYTPDENCGLLLGITRKKIIELSDSDIVLARSSIRDILEAEEVFITNSSFGVLNVKKIMPNNVTFTSTKYSDIFTRLLKDDLENYVRKEP